MNTRLFLAIVATCVLMVSGLSGGTNIFTSGELREVQVQGDGSLAIATFLNASFVTVAPHIEGEGLVLDIPIETLSDPDNVISRSRISFCI